MISLIEKHVPSGYCLLSIECFLCNIHPFAGLFSLCIQSFDVCPLLLYTPQNNLRTTQCKIPKVVYLVRYVAQTRHDIEKRFSVPLKGVKNKAFPIKNLAFKIFAFSASQIYIFSQIFKKSRFIISSDV